MRPKLVQQKLVEQHNQWGEAVVLVEDGSNLQWALEAGLRVVPAVPHTVQAVGREIRRSRDVGALWKEYHGSRSLKRPEAVLFSAYDSETDLSTIGIGKIVLPEHAERMEKRWL